MYEQQDDTMMQLYASSVALQSDLSQGSGQARAQPRSNQGGPGPEGPKQGEASSASQSNPSSATQAAQGTPLSMFTAAESSHSAMA